MSSNTGAVRTTRRRLQLGADDREPTDTPSALTEGLARLVEVLDAAAEEAGWGNPPALVRITAWPGKPITDGFDLGVRPIDDGMSVVEALAGFTAPDEWLALGVVTEGNARHLVDRTDDRQRVRCVHLVDRSGASASTLRLQGGEVTVLDGHQPEGRIDDVCRRALGLATNPPAHSSIELWTLVWLDRVLAAQGVAEAGAHPRWRAVAELHPAVAMIVHDDPQWRGQAAENIGRLGELLAEVHSWSVLRASCAAGDWPVDDVTPAVAGWLDDGAFSRWVLGGFPPIDQLVQAVSASLPPSVARRVTAAVRGWQLLSP